MANPRRRRSRKNRSRSRSRKNPFRASKRYSFRRRHSSRRRNPGIAGFSSNELIKLAAGAGIGVVGSKYLTQLLLQGNNTGPMGYAGSAVATLAIGWAAHKFLGAKDLATGIIAGGLGALALRIFQENVSLTSSSMSGLGDPDMAALGDYRFGNSPVPVYGFQGAALPAVQPVAGGPLVMAKKRG